MSSSSQVMGTSGRASASTGRSRGDALGSRASMPSTRSQLVAASALTTFARSAIMMTPPLPPRVPSVAEQPPRAPLRNPGWMGRIAEGTAYGFGAGLVGGAVMCWWKEELNVAPAIAGTAGNFTLVSAIFLGCKELTRLVRQQDDWINSAVGGALSGSMCAVAFKGRAYSASVGGARGTGEGGPASHSLLHRVVVITARTRSASTLDPMYSSAT